MQPRRTPWRSRRRRPIAAPALAIVLLAAPVAAQTPETGARTAVIEEMQAERFVELHAYVPNKAEKYLDYVDGLGFRFHGALATPLRVDFANGNEGFHIVFAASAVF